MVSHARRLVPLLLVDITVTPPIAGSASAAISTLHRSNAAGNRSLEVLWEDACELVSGLD